MALPPNLARIVDLFASAPPELRLPALLEYVDKVDDLPPELEGRLERVHECQTPFFVKVDVTATGTVVFHFDAPREAPTTRGYAGILTEGLRGTTPADVLAVPDDFYDAMGLSEVITPLRLRGMWAILATIKRQLRDREAS